LVSSAEINRQSPRNEKENEIDIEARGAFMQILIVD